MQSQHNIYRLKQKFVHGYNNKKLFFMIFEYLSTQISVFNEPNQSEI